MALLERLRGLENVSVIVDYFEKTDSYVIVLKDCGSCVDLFDFISDNGHLEEKRAKLIFEQVLDTILKIHEKGESLIFKSSSNLCSFVRHHPQRHQR